MYVSQLDIPSEFAFVISLGINSHNLGASEDSPLFQNTPYSLSVLVVLNHLVYV